MSVSDKEDPDFEQHLTPAFEGTETKRDYPLGIFVADREVGSPSVQVILIAVFEGKNLVAFPHGAWNRTVAKRTLPPQSVVKPTLVEVLAVSAEDRTELQEDTFLKVWIGFLKPEFMMNVQLATDVSEGELIFGEAEGAPLLPSADALVAVAQEHFAFFSAEETGPGTRYPAHPRSSGSGAPDLETRMTRMEDTMIEINRTLQNLSPLIGKTTPPVLQPSSKKSSVPSKAGLGKERAKGQDYPGLDSAVVTAALQAGVPETSLREMQKLIGGNPRAQKLGDLTSHAKRADPLSEDDEDEPDVVVPQEAGECGSAKLSPIEQNLTHLTSIVEMLAEERKRVMGRNKLEAALDHAGPVSLEGSAYVWWEAKCSSSKSIALDVFRESQRDLPVDREAHVRRSTQSDFASRYESSFNECSKLGGVQVTDRQLQVNRVCGLVDCGHIGLAHGGRCGKGKSKGIASPVDVGSECRSRQLDFSCRAWFGARTTVLNACHSPRSVDRRWGATFLTAAGSQVGRNQPQPLERHRRLLAEKELSRQDAEGQRFGRWWKQHGVGLKKETEGKSQEQGSFGFLEPAEPNGARELKGGKVRREVAVDASGAKPLPGTTAATVRLPAFLNSLPRWLLKIHCGLRGFLRSIIQTQGARMISTSSTSIWPMPLPYPEVFTSGSHGSKDAPWKRLVCLQVAVLDWYILNRPDVAPSALGLGARLNSRQWSAVKMLEYLVQDGNTPEFIAACDMGRGAAKIENFQQELDALCRAAAFVHDGEKSYFGEALSHSFSCDAMTARCGTLVGEVGRSAVGNAKRLVADRLNFPAGPRFDPRAFFDDATLKRYEHSLSDGLDPQTVGEPPRVKVNADTKNKIALYQKMACAGMLKPIPPGSFHDTFRSGLFAVHKDETKDRMVLDGRPANLVDKGQGKWSAAMASASVLGQIHLDDHIVLVSSGADLKDFFYQFVVNAERTARNVLAGTLTLDEAKTVFGENFSWPHKSVTVGLSTLAMGDRNAVEYAQCAHLGLCLQKSVAECHELLGLRIPLPRGLFHVGIIVDDLVLLEQVLRCDVLQSDWFEHTTSFCRLNKAIDGYKSVGLVDNPKKAFKGELCSKYWGCEIDGLKGLLRSSSQRLWPTVLITLRTASLGLATVGLLEALAGSWVSLLSVRRRLFCVLDLIFDALAWYEQPRAVIRLSPEMKSELISLSVLGSLAAVNLRADFACFVSATDASSESIAGVVADTYPMRLAKSFQDIAYEKGIGQSCSHQVEHCFVSMAIFVLLMSFPMESAM